MLSCSITVVLVSGGAVRSQMSFIGQGMNSFRKRLDITQELFSCQ